MSTALFTPSQGRHTRGATTSTTPSSTSLAPDFHAAHTAHTARAAEATRPGQRRKGGLLRAAKIFAGTAVSVVLLGEYGEDAGVIRR
ncbi:hypothetical protein ABZY31_19120 [Streptomyces sp. NPDC006529]|uniref:hypothetical protein n=1 Tax=Streptomyces sp. NPDC006529 TaxID=3157177 RepID=UPI0033A9A184